jgi:hypothetical protein
MRRLASRPAPLCFALQAIALLLCAALAKGGDWDVLGPPMEQRGYSAALHFHVELEDGGDSGGNATSGVYTEGFLPALEKVRQIILASPDKRGKASVDLVMIGPGGRNRYYTWGSGGSLYEALGDAVRQARRDLKK